MEAIRQNRSEVATETPITVAIEDWNGRDVPEPVKWMAKPALAADIRSSFFTPVMAAGRSIGGLVLCASTPRPWPPEEVLLLQAVAQQIGTAAQRLHLAQEVRQQAQQLQQVLDTMADGMLLLDRSDGLFWQTPPVETISSYSVRSRWAMSWSKSAGCRLGHFSKPDASPTWRELIVEHPEWRMFQANARAVEICRVK